MSKYSDEISEYAIDNYKVERRYYILTQSAEETAYKILYLSEEEAEFLREIFNQEIVSGGGYCGCCHLSNDSFYAKDSATNAILEGEFN